MSGRERVIKNIETVDQAVKAEKAIEVGYHGVIDENIAYWLAVEEDLIESYTKLLKLQDSKKIKTTLTRIISDSENHVRMLTSIRKVFTKIVNDEHRHVQLLESLGEEFQK
jgi:rubrerythrin